MPFLDLDTNIPQQDIAEDFTEKLCSAAASILSKPKENINVTVRAGASLLLFGAPSPCVQLIISSIGVVGTAEENKEHSSKFFEFLTKALGLTPDRILLRFHPLEAWQIGIKGTVVTYM
ncbi:D-dopachrome decarboxylase-B-like [Rana temporaria]|uniref:D-dopachrome decarboxylase-B-like n=1 Tax=Rana temporaria TaxID=8407 RepID=UPI001AADD154|nr:D-dopachrome decarboxylase-B-like [Rana temporaria]